jgi:hypothetical protein
MVSTGVRCARALALTRYDLALNVGNLRQLRSRAENRARSFTCVRDNIAELGAEDNDEFVTIRSDPAAGENGRSSIRRRHRSRRCGRCRR